MRSGSALSSSRSLRRDAEANRGRILAAAADAFAELGLEAPVDEIARRAGVGMGTLYRRFPTKSALVEAIFEEHLDRLAALAEEGLRDDDPWRGFAGFLEGTVALQAQNRGFAAIVAMHLSDEDLLAQARKRVKPLVTELIERAQAAGQLRPDIVNEDISVLFWTSARVVDATRDIAPELWRRHLTLALDGLRPHGASALPHPPLTASQYRSAMKGLASLR